MQTTTDRGEWLSFREFLCSRFTSQEGTHLRASFSRAVSGRPSIFNLCQRTTTKEPMRLQRKEYILHTSKSERHNFHHHPHHRWRRACEVEEEWREGRRGEGVKGDRCRYSNFLALHSSQILLTLALQPEWMKSTAKHWKTLLCTLECREALHRNTALLYHK